MSYSRSEQIQDLFRRAVDLPHAERGTFLDREGSGDSLLRAVVEVLIDAHEAAPSRSWFAPSPSAHDPAPDPESIGPYRIVRKLGQGGMGTVYVAEQSEPLRRTVALKVIKRGMDTDEVLARFERERLSLALMSHPGIAQVHDAGTTADGRPYFVMEHVAGKPITEHCDDHTLAVSDRIELFLEVCHAVQHAHQKGIIHRDLKPSNILVALPVTPHNGEPRPKIIDFGLAKSIETPLTERTVATRLGQIMGTPGYMSPEQMDLTDFDLDTRSDVYSLGVILYELLAGMLPFDATRLCEEGYTEARRIIREVEPARPSTRLSMANGDSELAARARSTDTRGLARRLRGDLDWIVMRCLEKDRDRRYASASELAADLERHLHHEPVLAGPPTRVYRLRKFVRRNRGLVAATTVVFVALAAGLAVASYGLVEANHQRDLAENALIAEAERAQQLEDVVRFQSRQLASVDPALMGARLRNHLLGAVRTAAERGQPAEGEVAARIAEAEKMLAAANFTNLALTSLDENIFVPTSEAIDQELTTQPLVRAQLLQALADTLREMGLYAAARAPQEKALDLRKQHLGAEDPLTLDSMISQARLLMAEGTYGEPRVLFESVLDARRRCFGDDHPATLEALNGMGRSCLPLGKPDEAAEYFRQVNAIASRTLGDEHPTTLQNRADLGNALMTMGKDAEAEPHLLEVLAAHRRLMGNESLETAASALSVVSLLLEQGQFVRAEVLCREALDVRRRLLGDEHTATIDALMLLSDILQNEGKLAEAETCATEALATSIRVLGDAHPDTFGRMVTLGNLLERQAQHAKAESYLRRALEGQRQVFGDEHPETLSTMCTLGLAIRHQARYDEAERILRATLAGTRRVNGDDHSDTITVSNNLGTLLQAQGRFDEAERQLREALEARRRVQGEEHPSTLGTLNNVGSVLMDQSKFAEAESYFREAMEKMTRALGAEHPSTATVMGSLANALRQQRKFDEAESLYRAAIEILRRGLGNEHPSTAKAMTNLAALLRLQGRLEEAERWLQEGFDIHRRVLGADHPDTMHSAGEMGALLRDRKDFAAAEVCFRELLDARRRVQGNAHRDTVNTMTWLARTVRDLGRLEEAESLIEEAVRTARDGTPGPGDRITGVALAEHGLTLLAMKRYAGATQELVDARDTLARGLGPAALEVTQVTRHLARCHDEWHAAEPGAGHDREAAEWRAKLPPEEAKPAIAAGE